MGRLAGIVRREKKRAPMETLEQAEVSDRTGAAESAVLCCKTAPFRLAIR
jgi:hypothetical protein